MRKVIPKNVADEMTQPYIDDAVEKQIKAADVPPRNKLNISFENADRTDDNREYKSNQEAYEKNHGKLYDMTHKNTIPWKNYVVYLVLLSLLTTVFTFSKYMSGANVSSDASVSKFAYTISGTVEDVTIAQNKMNKIPTVTFEDKTNVASYDFTVTNNSEVTVTVKPTYSGNGNFGISFVDASNTALPANGLNLSIGASTKITMKVDPSKAGNTETADLKLDFAIVQVD